MELAPETEMELIPGKILQYDSLLLAEGRRMVQQEQEEEVEGWVFAVVFHTWCPFS